MSIQGLYEKAPFWIQNIGVNIMGQVIKKRRYGRRFFEELQAFEGNAYNPEVELRNFLIAIKDVPAYKDIFTPQFVEKLHSGSESVYSLLTEFPVIDKRLIKERIGDYLNKNYKGRQFTMRTSGTTGSGLSFPYPVDFENKQWALWWQYRRKWGIQFDTWCGWFGGKKIISPSSNKAPYWRINNPGRQVMYSSYHLTKETVTLFYEDIKKRDIAWIHGYPSHIARFSSLIIDAGLEPLSGVKWVTTGAEGLVGNQLALINKAFPNALVGQHYGQNEGVAIMNRIGEGEWEVVDSFSYVEFIPLAPECPNICRIVGTGFFNTAFPLVRYDTGDLAEIQWRTEEGESRPQVVRIDGRTSNTVKQTSGHEITEAALSIVLHDFETIAEAQFHQVSLNEVALWVVKGKGYVDSDEEKLMKALEGAFDADMRVSIKYVDAVERTKAGKLRLVVPEMM